MNWVPCLYLKSRVTVMCIHKSLLMSPKLALNFLKQTEPCWSTCMNSKVSKLCDSVDLLLEGGFPD